MSGLPSPSTSPRSSVACYGVPASSVCRSKTARRRLLQPHQRRPAATTSSPPTNAAADDVEVAVAVEVGGLRALRRRAGRQRVLDERERARVLEPLDAVVRLQDEVVERVAVGEQDVQVAVPVEVDELDARRAPVRVRRRVDRLRREARGPCPLLRNATTVSCCCASSDDEVGLAVLVEVDRRDVDGAGARVDQLRHEGRRLPVGGAVLEQR